MSARLTLDDYMTEVFGSPREAALYLARSVGDRGFTCDDLRTVYGVPCLKNPGSVLGSLVQSGDLRVLGEETARTPSSKGRRVRRFVLTVQGDSQ